MRFNTSMYRRLGVTLAVAMTGLCVASRPASAGPGVASTNAGSAAAAGALAAGRVVACGASLCLGGKAFYPYGSTFYDSGSRSGIVSNPRGAITLARDQHLNTVRAVNWLSQGGTIASATTNSDWVPLDRFVGDAESAGMKTVLDLSDFTAILMKHCINPYTAFPQWDRYIDYAAARTNTVTGKKYGNDPEIAWVQFAGDIREAGYELNGQWHDGKYYTYSGAGNDAGNARNPSPETNWGTARHGPGACSNPLYFTTQDVTKFFANVEATWKRVSSILTMPGGLIKLDETNNGGIDYKAIFANRNNDLCGFKTYGGMEAWLPTGVSYCRRTLHKPSINDEWGYQQNLGDSRRAGAFKAQFRNNASAGVAGNLIWNGGYQRSPTSYDVDNGSSFDRLTFEQIIRHAP